MNPNPQFRNATPKINRAFAQLFIHASDAFAFSVDSATRDGQELQGHLVPENANNEGKILVRSTGFPTIEYRDELETIQTVCEETLGLACIEEESGTKPTSEPRSSEEYDEEEYEYHLASYQPVEHRPYEWNVPHLIVYGHLSPEVTEACNTVFSGTDIEFTEIRNHYVVYGETLTEKHKTKLHDTIGQMQGFEDDIQFAQSQVSTADFI